MEYKRVHVTNCPEYLLFIHAIKEVTHKSLLECKNIADSLRDKKNLDKIDGILLLNESSITPIEWEEITKIVQSLEWKYI